MTIALRDDTILGVFWTLQVPIFRQATRTTDRFRTSKHKGLRYSTYAYYLDHLEWVAGWQLGQGISRTTKKWEEGIKKALRQQYLYHIRMKSGSGS